ncbi:MAG: carboxypeptidase-like regulatory domain-containing protein, partial [Bacteroidota bacterium]|nr:carboxypeptidase-like regulatory domain-containing protein [Bacteroidota bacterium]
MNIGKIWVSGPVLQTILITFINPNQTDICTQTIVGQCGGGQQPGPQSSCLTNAITLSTGYDPVTGSVLPVSTPPSTDIKDPYWIIVSDPLPGTIEPRPASVINRHPAWDLPQPGSQWIAAYNSPSNSTNGVYRFRRCFCVEGRTTGIIDLKVFADDIVDSILFNGVKLTNRTPGLTNNWFISPPREYRDTVVVPGGTNCIEVFVRNTSAVAFGLNIAGSITPLPTLASALLADTCCNEHKCWIMGQKYHDINCNGKIDNGEPVLSGWTITATGSGGTYSATTGTDGWYSIQLPCGTYTLT